MRQLIFLLLCSTLSYAQLINDFSTEWQSAAKTYTFKDTRDDSLHAYNKSYKGLVLNNNLFYRQKFFDLTANIKYQADGTIPAELRENLNTYRFYAQSNPANLYNLSLSGGFERQITTDKGWVRDSKIDIINDTLYNPVDTIYTPEKYENIVAPDLNISWFGAGYNYSGEKLYFEPQFYYFASKIKGEQTLNPSEIIDSLRTAKIDAEDYEWQAKLSTGWNLTESFNIQVRGFYSDDLDSINYYNTYYGETGFGTNLVINDYKISAYAGAGILNYHEEDNFYGKSNLSITLNSNPNFNLKLKNNLAFYQDKTYSEKISLYGAWFFEQAGYDFNQISGYTSLNSKGAYKFARIGVTGRYWLNSWLNELDLGMKGSEIAKILTTSYRSQYYFNKLNSLYAIAEYSNFTENAFKLDPENVKISIGILSGLP